MSEFIDTFPALKAKAADDKARTQSVIFGLLEHISTEMERQHNLPSAEQVDGMREDAAAKGTELEHAQHTQAALQSELMKRQQELEKLHTLDQKIGVELKSLNEKMATMQTEMVTYANIDELKASNDRISELLEEKKVAYQRRCDGARAQVNLLAARYERLKSAIAGSDAAKGLETSEQKLKHYEQSIFAMREFIEAKSRETEYVAVREQCLRLTDEINAAVVRAQAAFVPGITATPY